MSSIDRTQAQRKRAEAEQSRRVAAQMSLPQDRTRFLKHAEGLDDEAIGLEQQADDYEAKPRPRALLLLGVAGLLVNLRAWLEGMTH